MIQDVLRAVMAEFSLSREDLLSSDRSARVARPRQIGMHVCRSLKINSYGNIGYYFGGRHPSTVIVADRKIECIKAQNSDFKQRVDRVAFLAARIAAEREGGRP